MLCGNSRAPPIPSGWLLRVGVDRRWSKLNRRQSTLINTRSALSQRLPTLDRRYLSDYQPLIDANVL
eukprot:8156115-Pyramimonas_sp.AAC.1